MKMVPVVFSTNGLGLIPKHLNETLNNTTQEAPTLHKLLDVGHYGALPIKSYIRVLLRGSIMSMLCYLLEVKFLVVILPVTELMHCVRAYQCITSYFVYVLCEDRENSSA
jgi:hypothetical protein